MRERARLEEGYLRALQHQSELAEQAEDVQQAILWARRLVDVDPIQEESHQRLIRLYLDQGRTTAALDQYKALQFALRRTLGMGPSAQTRSMVSGLPAFAALRAGDGPLNRSQSGGPPPKTRSWISPGHSSHSEDVSPTIISDIEGRIGKPGRLPTPLTRLFGRDGEISRITSALQPDPLEIGECAGEGTNDFVTRTTERSPARRMITLTGPGGCGKTRIALAAAHALHREFGGNVAFVSANDASNSDELLGACAAAAGVRCPRGMNIRDHVHGLFNSAPFLLVIDQFDHLTEYAATVRSLLLESPGLRCLVTSRIQLGLDGEQVNKIAPLEVPGIDESPELLLQYDSVRLFAERAQSISPDFQVTARNAGAVAQLVRQLDGLPLALELAATWVQTLSPHHMLARLSDRFTFLARRSGGGDPRHHTLEEVIAVSYNRLGDPTQKLFERLSLFPSTWTLEAAENIFEQPDTLNNLQRLCCHSLISSAPTKTGMRFTMLESHRDYASIRLTEPLLLQLRSRHAEYFLAFAERAEPHLHGPDQTDWLDRLEDEHENLLLALSWFQGRSDESDRALRLAGSLWRFWWHRGHFRTGRERLSEVLSRAQDSSDNTLGSVILGAAYLARFHGDCHEALRLTKEALKRFESSGNERARFCAVRFLAANPIMSREDPVQCLAWIEESIQVCSKIGDSAGLAEGLRLQGLFAWTNRDLNAAERHLTEALELFSHIGDVHGQIRCLGDKGTVALNSGSYGEASRLFEQMRDLSQRGDFLGDLSQSLFHLGNLECCLGKLDSAIGLIERSLAMRQRSGHREGIAESLYGLAVAVACSGDFERARSLQDRSLQLRKALGEKVDIALSMDHLARIYRYQDNIPRSRSTYEESIAIFRAARFHLGLSSSLHGLGLAMLRRRDVESALKLLHESLALRVALEDQKGMIECLEALAHAAVVQRKFQRAICLFGAGSAHRLRLGTPLCAVDQAEYNHAVTVLHTAVGENEFEDWWASGEDLEFSRAIEFAGQ